MERMLVISADGHAAAPPETYRPYLERRYHGLLEQLEEDNRLYTRFADIISSFPPEVLEVIDDEHAIRDGGLLGSWDVDRRVAEMDREGVAAELIISGTQLAAPPFFGNSNRPFPADVRAAGTRAYHRWIADCMAQAGGRLFASADPGPCLDMDATVEELHWVAAHGFKSVAAPGIVSDASLPPVWDEYFEPFWRTCAELGLALSVHAAHGMAQGYVFDFLERLSATADDDDPTAMLEAITGNAEGSPFASNFVPQHILWSLMAAGVFDRYPGLHLALTEVRADWIPETLSVLDARFDAGDTPLQRKPSEYWASNCFAAVSSIKRSEVRLRASIGVDRMMFGRDYPHPEGTWPNTWEWLRDALAGVPEPEVRALIGENALDCYDLDAEQLTAVAARIGPRPSDIFTNAPVDPRKVEHFDRRGGYFKSMEHIDAAQIESLFDADMAGVAQRS
jgi:predicted TIM-barrel fold metal-dependent hydrolase